MKHFKRTRQAAAAACIALLLLFTGTACGKDTPGDISSAPEDSQVSDPSSKVPENGQASDSSSDTPENGQVSDLSSKVPENGQASDSSSDAPENSPAPGANPAAGETTPAPDGGQAAQNSQAQITLEEAKNAALASAGLDASQVTYTKEKLDYEDGIAVYEIEFYTASQEYEYEIDAASGAVYSMHSEAFDGSHTNHPQHSDTGHSSGGLSTDPDIGMELAKTIALEHAGFTASDVTMKKTKLDTEDGRAVYEVEFYQNGREYEYTILASDGTILEYEVD